MREKIEKTVIRTETAIELVECPLCGGSIMGLLTSEVHVPDNKLVWEVERANVKVEPVAMDLIEHRCAKVEPVAGGFVERRTGRYNRIDANTIATEALSVGRRGMYEG